MARRKFVPGDIVEFKTEPAETPDGYLVVDKNADHIMRQEFGECTNNREIFLIFLKDGSIHSAFPQQLRRSTQPWVNV